MDKTASGKVSITKRFVDSASGPKEYVDATLKGFRLKVTGAGAKVYLMYGKVKGNPTPVRIIIGHHGDKLEDGTDLTADKARAEAEKIRGELRAGVNRTKQRKEKAKAEAAERTVKGLTVGQAFEEFLEKNQRPRTKKTYRSVFKNFDDWADIALVDITQEHVLKRFDKIKRRSPSVAAHAMRIFRAVRHTATVRHGDDIAELLKPNPVQILGHMRSSREEPWDSVPPRDDYIADEHLPAFYRELMKVESDTARDYLMVALLAGLRRSEICTLTWGELSVDLSKRRIIICAGRTKNKRRHVLAMTDQLYEIFSRRAASPAKDRQWVFPGNTRPTEKNPETEAGHFDDPTWQIEKIVDQAKIPAFTSHSLRRTFATAADSLGYNLQEVQRLLNHKGSSVTERHYIQAQAERTKEPMQRINDRLFELMTAKPATSNVIDFPESSAG